MFEQQRFKFTDIADEQNVLQQTFNKIYFERPNECSDVLNLARNLFDLSEYRKCAHMIKPFANPKH